jgi:hypothetical protein
MGTQKWFARRGSSPLIRANSGYGDSIHAIKADALLQGSCIEGCDGREG